MKKVFFFGFLGIWSGVAFLDDFFGTSISRPPEYFQKSSQSEAHNPPTHSRLLVQFDEKNLKYLSR
jgi:hypothetical protein